MKEKIRNLFDEWKTASAPTMKVRSRYKSMGDIINMIEPIVNQEVEKRIAERMPSEEEINKQAEQAAQRDTKDGRIGIIIDSTYYGVFCDALEWLRSRLTCSEKPNNLTEGGE